MAAIWSSIDEFFRDLSKKYLGKGLTDAEREANSFSAEQANIAFQRELDASNTANQRKVADLQAAGINPLMAVSQGVSLPSASAPNSVSPSSASIALPNILSLVSGFAQLPLQLKELKANIALKDAQKAKTDAETNEQNINNEYLRERNELELEGQRRVNDMTNDQRAEIWQRIRKADHEIQHIDAQTLSEEARYTNLLADAYLKNITADKYVAMLPFEQAYMSAQTTQAKASAAAQFAQAAWQNGLIDAGMIAISVEEAGYKRDSAEYNASIDRVRAQVSGDKPMDMSENYSLLENLIKGFGRVKYFINK